MWVKDGNGFKHKNKCNTALIDVVFLQKNEKKFSI